MREIKKKVGPEGIEIKSTEKMRDGIAKIRIIGKDKEKKEAFKKRIEEIESVAEDKELRYRQIKSITDIEEDSEEDEITETLEAELKEWGEELGRIRQSKPLRGKNM